MVHLFLFVTHGGRSNINLFHKKILGLRNPNVLAICVNYDKGHIQEIMGTASIMDWLELQESLTDLERCFWDLFAYVKKTYQLQRAQIIAYIEANFLIPMHEKVTQPALKFTNAIDPSVVVWFTGTPQCRRYMLHWMKYHQYPLYEALFSADFVNEADRDISLYKSEDICDADGMALELSVVPPVMAILDKPKVIPSLVEILANLSRVTIPTIHIPRAEDMSDLELKRRKKIPAISEGALTPIPVVGKIPAIYDQSPDNPPKPVVSDCCCSGLAFFCCCFCCCRSVEVLPTRDYAAGTGFL